MTPAEQAFEIIERATDAKALFGTNPKGRYRELAVLVHPDHFLASMRDRAHTVFIRLNKLYAEFNGKASKPEQIIGDWLVGDPIAKGDICEEERKDQFWGHEYHTGPRYSNPFASSTNYTGAWCSASADE